MYPCHMTVPDLLCECTYEQGTNHNLWFGGFQSSPYTNVKSEAIETEYDDILLRVRNKSREKILGSRHTHTHTYIHTYIHSSLNDLCISTDKLGRLLLRAVAPSRFKAWSSEKKGLKINYLHYQLRPIIVVS